MVLARLQLHPGAGRGAPAPAADRLRGGQAMHDLMSLSGKVAVVLGASGGIGTATARALASAGATVVATWRSDASAAEALAAALPGTGHLALPAVVEETPTLTELATTVERRLGRADILVNAAGFTKAVPHA